MFRNRKIIISILAVSMMILTSFGLSVSTSPTEIVSHSQNYIGTFDSHSTLAIEFPSAITVSDSNPFYSLIATPLAIYYNEYGEQTVSPMYIKHLDDPSKSVVRAEQQIGIYSDYIISDLSSPKKNSLSVAETFWDESSTALVIKEDETGYGLGIVATPIASYLSIPVIVTNEIDEDVKEVLNDLGVDNLYICGDLHSSAYWVKKFYDVEEVIDECIDVIFDKFGETVDYITMANPLDVSQPAVLDTTIYEFNGKISSGTSLPTHAINSVFGNAFALHKFTIPEDYKYVQLKIDLKNLDFENVDSLGDKLSMILVSPQGPRYMFGGTNGGIPVRDVDGSIVEDCLHYEITIYDNPGEYGIQIYGQWFSLKKGSYDVTVTLENIEHPIVPLMDNLSSIAPYITAYHKGIVFAKPEFAFAADDDVLYNGTTCPGVTQPGTNPNLLIPSNEHTMQIHDELNELLAQIASIPIENLEELRNYYAENPAYVAIAADPTMIPMYFYFNPDGKPEDPAYMTGFALPSDFIYGDIDVDKTDPENNTFTYWPFQENIVGRVTGRDVQDCSALIARTIFYYNIIDDMGEWKNNALVQTGCGLEFQNLPIITRLSQFMGQGHGDPTKFPTGESEFINLRLKDKMEKGFSNTRNTFWLQSQIEGFSKEDIKQIKQTGLLNRLLFPSKFVEFLNSKDKVNGGNDQINSNLIFTFAHGSYSLFEHGDVFIDSRGFPGVTTFSRIISSLRSDLSSKGAYSVRSVNDMDYGPSVIFVVSCITARTDGIIPENALSQAFLYAGMNAYIGATRFTADPGYLPPRPLPGGWGIGILGLTKAILDLKLKGVYPESHFGASLAEDFIVDLIENDATTGLALRNAKNVYLEKDANTTFLWTPPLSFTTGCSFIDEELQILTQPIFSNEGKGSRELSKKYVALHEFTLYGDPAFNPYQSVNNG